MDKKLADKIGEAVQKLMEKEFPEVGWMLVGTDSDSVDMLITGNACIICITKGILMEIMHGRIKHLDNHETENIHFVNLDDEDEVKH